MILRTMNKLTVFLISTILIIGLASSQSLFQLNNGKFTKPDKLTMMMKKHTDNPDILCSEYKDFLSNIILKFLEKLRTHMDNGIPSMGIPPLDPLAIENTTFHSSKPYQFNIDGEIGNTLVEGLKTFNVTKISTSFLHLQANITLNIPNFFVTGRYYLNGHLISILPISGKGPYTLIPQNLMTSVTSTLHLNNKRLQITSMDFDVDMSGLFVKFEGIFGGGAIGSFFNSVMNRFGLGIFHRVERKVHQNLRTSLITLINEKLKEMPLYTLLQAFDKHPQCKHAITRSIIDAANLAK